MNHLADLLDHHADELTDAEREAFADMRSQEFLSKRQREWVDAVHRRVVPDYVNLASSGMLARGTPTAESRALDRMLSAPKPLRPPLPRPTEAKARASRRHCGNADDGCYAFVNGDCACGCCR